MSAITPIAAAAAVAATAAAAAQSTSAHAQSSSRAATAAAAAASSSQPSSVSASSSGSRAILPVALTIAASATAVAAFVLALRAYRARTSNCNRSGNADDAQSKSASSSPTTAADDSLDPITWTAPDEHSIPLPSRYSSAVDYTRFHLYVLFPSTVESEREKHYAVMSANSLPGAQATLLSPQDAQKKACTYGLDDSQIELTRALALLRFGSTQYVHVSLESYSSLFVSMSPLERSRVLVLNLCDGTELDGIPGISVLRHLESVGVAYTGADEAFFRISTYKMRMKRAFQQRGVDTSVWVELAPEMLAEWSSWREKEGKPIVKDNPDAPAAAPAAPIKPLSNEQRENPESTRCSLESSFSPALASLLQSLRAIPAPLLVKPDDSYCSCGITTRSVCFQSEDALDYACAIASQFSGVYVERFIRGREFTVLVTGEAQKEAMEEMRKRAVEASSATAAAAAASAASSGAHPFSLSLLPLSSLSDTASLPRSFEPVERIFDPSLPYFERFISYELFWEIARAASEREGKQEDEFVFGPVSAQEIVKRYAAGGANGERRVVSVPLSVALRAEALKAYIAVGGCGYARVDIRVEDTADAAGVRPIQVLEVNANAGISQYKQTAMGEILRESRVGFHEVLDVFCGDAIKRRQRKELKA